MDFFVTRTIDVGVDLTVTIRVPRTTAELWRSELLRMLDAVKRDRLLSASADGKALRRAKDLLRERGIRRGRWVATFDADRVDLVTADG